MRQLKRQTWPHQITIRNEIMTDVCSWCNDHLGTEWMQYTYYTDAVFAFKNELDYIMFKLRWK